MAHILHFSTKIGSIKMFYRFFTIIFLFFNWTSASFAQFFEDGYTIKDVRNNIIWLRCTVGQTWDYDTKTCVGEIVKLNHDEIEIARTQAAEQLGGNWRLPTLEELESLVCETCEKPKINEKYFPGISPEAYWTQTQNKFNSKMFWTVNFMTGHNYSRFFAYQQLPVLFVQDR
jgi:hypothetical protein